MWADTGYTGRFVRHPRKICDLAVAIVKHPDQAKGFVLLHRRDPPSHEAIRQLSNRLTR